MGEADEFKTISKQVNDEEWEVIHMYWDKAYEQYYVRIWNKRTEEEKSGYVI